MTDKSKNSLLTWFDEKFMEVTLVKTIQTAARKIGSNWIRLF